MGFLLKLLSNYPILYQWRTEIKCIGNSLVRQNQQITGVYLLDYNKDKLLRIING